MVIDRVKPFQGVSISSPKAPNIKRRYSVTQDIVAFRRCARQYGAFNVHKYAPAYQTQTYFGTIIHQVLDRCHAHFNGKINPLTKGTLPDNEPIPLIIFVLQSLSLLRNKNEKSRFSSRFYKKK